MYLAFQLKVKWFHMSYVKAHHPNLDLAIYNITSALGINAMTTNPKPIRGQEGSLLFSSNPSIRLIVRA